MERCKYLSRVYVVSLGCAKNLVDTEEMLGKLTGTGYQVFEDPHEADMFLINTCAFLKEAREEAYQVISEIVRYKQKKKRVYPGSNGMPSSAC